MHQQPAATAPAAPVAPAPASPHAGDLKQQIIDINKAVEEATREGGPARPVIAGSVPGVPGITIDPGFGRHRDADFPPQVVDISIAFFLMCAVMVIGWPIARAFGKRLEHRAVAPSGSPAMADQLQRIEQAVDAMSIEIERISESQRFMAKLQNAQAAEPIALPADRR